MDLFVAAVRRVSQLCGVLAAGALLAAILVVCQMVVLRYLLAESTIWQTEFVTYAIVGATFVGSPYVLLTKGHVNVDVLPHYLGDRARFWLALAASLGALGFCGLLTWYSTHYFLETWHGGWRTDTVWAPPLWIPTLPLPVGAGLLCLQYLADILCLVTGREPPFAAPPPREPA